ncbi:MAG: putative monovalent cation/H+ antiporter subunit A [Candidatus Hydrogenedentota bacterium]|nr:MAG: putative monovalent cation/H+ antiporter subunit A [Candidatus Hydrogenedentota bacterium]
MLAAVLSGFVLSAVAPLLCRAARRTTGWFIALLPLALFVYFSLFIDRIAGGEAVVSSVAWVPSLGIALAFSLDGLSLLFAVLIAGIGVLVVIYSNAYLAGHRHLGRFYAYILTFMASMLGLVLSDNLITLFIFWELTSLSSYLLIGFNNERESARKAALQALLITAVGGLALLVGLLLLAEAGQGFALSTLLGRGERIRSHPLYVPILILILTGAFTKSAQFPFHFWLPDAMEAPTPVSSYLHSATMVTAGIYLLARISPIMGGTAAWQMTILAVGATTMLMGGYMAVKETDLKRLLAYSTLSILGVLTFLLGIGTRAAIEAAMAYLIIHALYKAALFLAVGIVDHETGTRDVTQLGGLARTMPWTAFAAGLAALSMAGLPPLFGFIGKELLYAATLEAPLPGFLLTGVASLTSVLMVAAAGIVGFRPFFGRETKVSEGIHEAPLSMRIAPIVLSGLGLLIGILPDFVAGNIVSPAVAAVLSQPVAVKLRLLHGLTVQLVLSGVTFALGVGAYVKREALARAIGRLDFGAALGPSRGYRLALDGMNGLARLQTRLLQSGHLHFYLLIIIVSTVALVGFCLLNHGTVPGSRELIDIRFHEGVVVLIILVATLVAVFTQSRLLAVVALGAVGYSVGLVFIMFGAPDLAMTQYSIDTLTVVLLVLVLYRLPRFGRYSRLPERIRDGVAAVAAGILITTLALTTASVPARSRISPYFAENSYLLARGRNIVNVILVDFRALDTLGEVTVLAVAAIGVYSLLKLRTNYDEKR